MSSSGLKKFFSLIKGNGLISLDVGRHEEKSDKKMSENKKRSNVTGGDPLQVIELTPEEESISVMIPASKIHGDPDIAELLVKFEDPIIIDFSSTFGNTQEISIEDLADLQCILVDDVSKQLEKPAIETATQEVTATDFKNDAELNAEQESEGKTKNVQEMEVSAFLPRKRTLAVH
ncbi:uncharacterized protein [Venturia canescens]|uniref:uncharacterized protein n=1 Tax=Venturia canescens TaxID=32260 RepID=UPI001C9C59A1|nr:uncharacterized protein LOC122416884 [Venturia canescens]